MHALPRTSEPHRDRDCASLFSEFIFAPIEQAEPPSARGIYVVRVADHGHLVRHVLTAADSAVAHLAWPMVEKKMHARLARMNRITSCPIIYLGSAGIGESSAHTLHGRYHDFAGRHTAMFPIWALLYHGWKLDYGWFTTDHPREMEIDLKNKFMALHEGNLPALVER